MSTVLAEDSSERTQVQRGQIGLMVSFSAPWVLNPTLNPRVLRLGSLVNVQVDKSYHTHANRNLLQHTAAPN